MSCSPDVRSAFSALVVLSVVQNPLDRLQKDAVENTPASPVQTLRRGLRLLSGRGSYFGPCFVSMAAFLRSYVTGDVLSGCCVQKCSCGPQEPAHTAGVVRPGSFTAGAQSGKAVWVAAALLAVGADVELVPLWALVNHFLWFLLFCILAFFILLHSTKFLILASCGPFSWSAYLSTSCTHATRW